MPSAARSVSGQPASPRWKAALLGVRLALWLGIVGCLTSIVHALVESPSSPAPSVVTHSAPHSLPFQSLRRFLQGGWQFGEGGWNVLFQELPWEQVHTRLGRPAESLSTMDVPEHTLERDVLRWLQRLATKTETGAFCVYTRDQGRERLRALTSVVGGRERVQLFQIVWPADEARAVLLEVQPASAVTATRRQRNGLPPLPDGVQPAASRVDADGRIAGELLGPVESKCFFAHWQQTGWQVDETAGGAELGCRLLQRGNHTAAVWVWGESPAGEYLLLVPVANVASP